MTTTEMYEETKTTEVQQLRNKLSNWDSIFHFGMDYDNKAARKEDQEWYGEVFVIWCEVLGDGSIYFKCHRPKHNEEIFGDETKILYGNIAIITEAIPDKFKAYTEEELRQLYNNRVWNNKKHRWESFVKGKCDKYIFNDVDIARLKKSLNVQ